MDPRPIRRELERLFAIPQVRKGFGKKDDALRWANEVAPLLQFKEEYYLNFVRPMHDLHGKHQREFRRAPMAAHANASRARNC